MKLEEAGRTGVTLREISADMLEAELDAHAQLLHACVHAGASINFVMPFPMHEAASFWTRKVLPSLRAGGLTMLSAYDGGKLAGSVQLDHDTPPNQPHRAELRKMIVHPDFRRRGIARLLIAELEVRARRLGRTLITLDTRTGDFAEPLYISAGFIAAGTIPGYARDVSSERLDAATFMYKRLDP
jgi:ribosomal protein S18 acetylase RimI-like enzyme